MNRPQQVWRAIARSAGRVKPAAPDMPFGLDALVVAAWRVPARADEFSLWRPLLQRAVICACAVMLVSVASNYVLLEADEPNPVTAFDQAVELVLDYE